MTTYRISMWADQEPTDPPIPGAVHSAEEGWLISERALLKALPELACQYDVMIQGPAVTERKREKGEPRNEAPFFNEPRTPRVWLDQVGRRFSAR